MVELKTSIKPIISCATNINSNIDIHTETSFVKRARENVLEFLLINHPLDCPICDQAGECDLQDQSLMYGSDRGRFKEMKRSVDDKQFGPVIKTIMTRCIHCTRCIRFADEVAGLSVLGAIGRGENTEIKMVLENFFDSEISGNVIDLCPVGALTSKPYAFTSRPWELKSIESIDPLDGLNSNIRIDVKGNRIFRILPKRNELLNEEWIGDLIRFSYESIQSFRVKFPYLNIYYTFYIQLLSFQKDVYSSFRSRISWDQCWVLLKILFRYNFHNFFFFLGNEVGTFISYLFYFFFQNSKKSFFFIENDVSFNIDHRGDIFFSKSIEGFLMNNYYLIYNLNLKESLPVLNARIKRNISNALYKQYFLYIGSNIKWTYFIYHIGFSYWIFFSLMRSKSIFCNYFYKLSYNRKLSLLTDSLNFGLLDLFDETKLFQSVEHYSCFSFSNMSGLYEFGLKSSNFSQLYLKGKSFHSSRMNLSYFLKTNTDQFPSFVENKFSFCIYQGSYLSEGFDSKIFNYLFLPCSNVFEQEDIYCNIMGDIQYTNQIIDLFEREEVFSDFYILSRVLLYFVCSELTWESVFNFDLLLNELIFYYLNYFCFLFDSIPTYNNICYFELNKNFFLKNNVDYLPVVRKEFDWFNYFYVRYSKTLYNSLYMRWNKGSMNFSYLQEI
jgi:hypothetical protein